MNKNKISDPIMGLGNAISSPNFSGKTWLKMLSTESSFDCNIYNVTFEAGAYNSWHKHDIGQILLCTEGVGFYQERGKKAERLNVGDVVNIPANIEHWHGAAPDCIFTHIGITPKASKNQTVWLDPLSKEDYEHATK